MSSRRKGGMNSFLQGKEAGNSVAREPLSIPPLASEQSADSETVCLERESAVEEKPSVGIWALLTSILPDGGGGSVSEPNRTVFLDFDRKEKMLLAVIMTPLYLEKIVLFGCLLCLDQFLSTIVLAPLRFFLSLLSMLWSLVKGRHVTYQQISAFFNGAMLFIVLFIMSKTDSSAIYHEIRGQSILKLYVLINILDVIEKLCSSYGHDLTENLLQVFVDPKKRKFKKMAYYLIATLLYCGVHTVVSYIQMVSLSVASTTDMDGLFAMLISNQFAELKSSVLKKNEQDNCFQYIFADIVERFSMIVYLCTVFLMHFRDSNSLKATGNLIFTCLMILFSELMTDSIKHGFINKFNEFEPEKYRLVKLLLCRDVLQSKSPTIVDASETANRRIGLAPIPICCVFLNAVLYFFDTSTPSLCIAAGLFVCALILKFLTSVYIGVTSELHWDEIMQRDDSVKSVEHLVRFAMGRKGAIV